MDIDKIRFDGAGLVPAIAQDADTKQVLMLAYMNREALELTLKTREAHYYSRSRKALWHKGETSGHIQKVVSVAFDCDFDAVLLEVEQQGCACHTGQMSCFFNMSEGESGRFGANILREVAGVIADRRANPVEGSYTNYLLDKGRDKILKKVGEESAEVIIAAKNGSLDELRYETADLLYHLLVLLENEGLKLEDVYAELASRR